MLLSKRKTKFVYEFQKKVVETACWNLATKPKTTNVKTVKEQTFHKRSANFRNLTGTSEFVTQSASLKEIISIWSRGADSGPNLKNLFSTRQIRERYQNVLVSLPKQFRNVCPFVLTLLPKTFGLKYRWQYSKTFWGALCLPFYCYLF